MLTAMFLAPEQDVGHQLASASAKRLICAGARLYTLGDKAALSIKPLPGWCRGAVKVVARDRAIVEPLQEAACAA